MTKIQNSKQFRTLEFRILNLFRISDFEFRILFLIFLLSTFYFLFSILPAQAARLYFEPQEQVIGTEGEFSVAVNVDADKPVNTISAAVNVSPFLNPYDVNEGNSIINFWIDKPHFDEASRLLTFSGIIPGGFQGRKARLMILKFRIKAQEKISKEQKALLSFDKEKTKVYLNTPDGIEDVLALEKIELPIAKGKENIGVEISDSDPPESFKPEIAKDAGIFEGKYFLVFATQDKGLGIERYDVQENRRQKIEDRRWEKAESPYLLKDQELRSYIYVKAIDKAGNERIATVEPKYPLKWYERWGVWGIIIVAIIIVVLICRLVKKSRRNFGKLGI